MKLWEVS